MSRAISYSMKKAPKKPRAPKPKAPKMRQKQKQSLNVKIHINNARPARPAPALPRSRASPFPQPVASYPIFRDVMPPPPTHYNPVPVAQPALVAHGFHGIPPAAARVRRAAPPSHSPLASSGYASDLSDITNASSRPSRASGRSAPRAAARRAPQRIVVGSGAPDSTSSAMSGLGAMNNSGSILSHKSGNTPIIPREPIPTGVVSTPEARRAERLRTGAPPGISLAQLRSRIVPAAPFAPPTNPIIHLHAPAHRSPPSSHSSEKGSKR